MTKIVKPGHKFPDPETIMYFSPETVKAFKSFYEASFPYLELVMLSFIKIVGTALCVAAVALMVYLPILLIIWIAEKLNALRQQWRNAPR